MKIKPLAIFAIVIMLAAGITVQSKQSLRKHQKVAEKPKFINIGPGGGGTARAIVFNPKNPNEIYVALDCGGLHKTSDGGKIWKNINKGMDYDGHINWNKTHSLLLVDENTLFTATSTGKIYRSTDKGEHWKIVYASPNFKQEISYLFQSRHDKNILYALTGKSDTADMHREKKPVNNGRGILISRNSGKKGTWKRLDIPKGNLPHGAIIICLEEDSTKADILYAATDMGFYISYDKGKNWTSLQKNIGKYRIKRMITIPDKPGWILATVGHFKGTNKLCALDGILVSKDYGKTWKKQGRGFQKEHNQFFAITRDPLNPKVLYLGCPQWSGGLYRSTDFGETWKLIYDKSNVSNFDIWHKSGAGPAVTKIITGGRDKNNDKLSDHIFLLGANSGLILKSSDSGKIFQQIICSAIDINGQKYWKGNGAIEFLCARSIAVDPFNADHLFLSYYDWNIFESIDGGKSFSKPIGPWFKKELIGSTKEVLFDPERKGTVYFGVTRGASGKKGGIIRKKNGKYNFIAGGGSGRSKRKIYNGFPASSVYGMALINLSEGGRKKRFLYAGANGHGMYRMNVDKKKPSWEKIGTGLVNRASKIILCIKTVQSTGSIFLGTANGIYKRENNQWKQLTGPETKYPFIKKVYALDVDLKNKKNIYASVMEKFAKSKDDGIYMSKDSGLNWKKISNAPLPYDMTFDQTAVKPTLYVASQVLGVYKVYLDNNNKWITESYANKENGLDHTRCWTVDICPLTSRMYIGTHGTGVYMSK